MLPTARSIAVSFLSTMLGFAATAGAGVICWVEEGGIIRLANTDGSNVRTVQSNTGGARGVAVDEPHGKIYFAAFSGNYIGRCNLDGSSVELVVGASSPIAVAVDPVGGRIFYAEQGNGGRILRANLDGTGATVLTTDTTTPNGIAYGDGFVYFTDSDNLYNSLRRIPAAGGSPSAVVGGLDVPTGVAYSIGYVWFGDTATDRIQRRLGDASDNTLLVMSGPLASDPWGVSVDPDGSGVYWARQNGGGIIRGNTGGGNAVVAVSTNGTPWGVSVFAGRGPSITQHPTSQTVCGGQPVTFSVIVSGTPSYQYQWLLNGNPISGQTSPSLTIASATSGNQGDYSVRVTTPLGVTTSDAATLTVTAGVTITGNPASATVCSGSPATFTVTANGAGTLTYQWRRGGNDILGATAPSYSIPNTSPSDTANYDCVVQNSCNSVTSTAASLNVNSPATITTSPTGGTACVGTPFTFTIAATGVPAPTFQWRKGTNAIPGANSPSYTINSVVSGDAGSYNCVVTNSCRSVTSTSADLVVNTPISITTQPIPRSVCAGASATFSTSASGSPAPAYQWRRGGIDIPGATLSFYTIQAATTAEAGQYDCVVRNTCNSVTTNQVSLSVTSLTNVLVQPSGQSAAPGSTAVFTLSFQGDASGATYQWRRNGNALSNEPGHISGVSTSTLTLSYIRPGDVGDYTCTIVRNGCTFTSSIGTLNVTSSCASAWSSAVSNATPRARFIHAMAFRSATGAPAEVLMFGGRSGDDTELLGDTWSWNGSNWNQKSTPVAPAARSDHAMAEGPGGTVVLLGGKVSLNPQVISGDCWVWDGTSWSQRTFAPGTAPAARGGHAMVYDPINQKTILFGGYAADGFTFLSDTWEWNGSTWTLVNVPAGSEPNPTRPSGRFAHGMTFDPVRQRVVLFGGNTGPGETWEYNPNPSAPAAERWSRRATSGPTPRVYGSLAYDAPRLRCLLFGGNVTSSDVWAWDGAAWTNTNSTCGPASSFTTIASAPFGSPAGPQMVMFGGGVNGLPPTNDETWLFKSGPCACLAGPESEVLRGQSVTLSVNTCTPSGASVQWYRDGVAIGAAGPVTSYPLPPSEVAVPGDFVYRAQVTTTCGTTLSAPYTLRVRCSAADPVAWSSATAVAPPPARVVHAMAYRSANTRPPELLMFGGRSGIGGGLLGDTWSWTGTAWEQKSVQISPSPRSDHAMAEGPGGTVVLTGGKTSLVPEVVSGEMWVWDGAAWSPRTFGPGLAPAPRGGHAMVFDPVNQKTILFGGFGADGVTWYSDTWEWDGAAWTFVNIPAGVEPNPSRPAARLGHAMSYDAQRRRVVLFGGSAGGGETWEYDPAPSVPPAQRWTRRAASGAPARQYGAMAFDAPHGRTILYGGQQVNGDAWAWNGTSWSNLGTACSPGPRVTAFAAAPFDSGYQLVAFGGSVDAAPPTLFDTWVLQPGPCACLSGPDGPIVRGQSVTLSVNTCNADDALVGWYRDGVLLSPATPATSYTLTPAEVATLGTYEYRAVVSTSCGSTRSGPLSLLIRCSLADVASLGGNNVPDGRLTSDDVIVFLLSFFNGLPLADVASLGGVPGRDGQLTADDVVVFLGAFFAGCS